MFNLRDAFNRRVDLSQAPALPGLSFRRFRGDRDFSEIARVISVSWEADGLERPIDPDEVAQAYRLLVNCNLKKDLLFSEVNGAVVGYSRVNWMDEEDARVFTFGGNLLPGWRRKGIGRALLHWSERRLSQLAESHPIGQPCFFQTKSEGTEIGRIALLKSEGYTPIRTFYEMVRPDLDCLPEAPMPDGLEVRPVLSEHLPAILSAYDEAMRDHWNYTPLTEKDIEAWLGNFKIDPRFWQVAWEGDHVAGLVISYLDSPEGDIACRGVTEPIAVRRAWRRKGLARSLLVQCMRELKASGANQAILHVDMENPNGALRLYEGVGFQVVNKSIIYRKPLLLN